MTNNINTDLVEKLEEAAHDVWMEGKIKDGWAYSAVTDKARKLHACLVPYAVLAEADKQSDRDFVIGIPSILKRSGLKITPLTE